MPVCVIYNIWLYLCQWHHDDDVMGWRQGQFVRLIFICVCVLWIINDLPCPVLTVEREEGGPADTPQSSVTSSLAGTTVAVTGQWSPWEGRSSPGSSSPSSSLSVSLCPAWWSSAALTTTSVHHGKLSSHIWPAQPWRVEMVLSGLPVIKNKL